MSLSQLFKSWSYEPLPTSLSNALSRKSSQRRYLIIVGLAFIGLVGVIWSSIRLWSKPSYSPLENYQDINPLPIVYAGYSAPSGSHAVVSTLYSDSYAVAVAVLGYSARKSNVTARLLLPYLEDRISSRALCVTRAVGWEPIPVPFIAPPHNGKGIHHRFRDQYTKLNIWAFDKLGVERMVYLDADTLVRRNFDELFDSPFNFGAVPDIWSDWRGFGISFNAGVLALRPSTPVLEDMKQKMEIAVYPLQMAEQAFLNLYFAAKAVRLPYVYNANLAIKTRSPVLWKSMQKEMRIVHYTIVKPFTEESLESQDLLTLDQTAEAIRAAVHQREGKFAEEVGWWKDVFEAMVIEKGGAIRACY